MADIADILASVDRDRDRDAAANDSDSRNVYVPEAAAIDHQVLTRFWVAERGAPEVLPWPGKLMERVMERARRQIRTIEDLSLSADGSSSSSTLATSSANLNLKLCILQSDLARTQYLVRSLLRQRLAKLTKYSLHYLRLSAPAEFSGTAASQAQSQSQSQSQERASGADSNSNRNGNATALLSAQELAFLRAHHSIMSAHYSSSFLGGFPPALRRLDDNTGGTNMVTAPETKEVVFVRCLGETVHIVVPVEQQQQTQTQMQTTAARAAAAAAAGGGSAWPKQEILGYGAMMRKGEVWVVRWEGIREAWEKGDVEVL